MPTIEITIRKFSAVIRLTATVGQPEMLAFNKAMNAVRGVARQPHDSMASLIAPYGSEEALAVARDLDAKITKLLEMSAHWTRPHAAVVVRRSTLP